MTYAERTFRDFVEVQQPDLCAPHEYLDIDNIINITKELGKTVVIAFDREK